MRFKSYNILNMCKLYIRICILTLMMIVSLPSYSQQALSDATKSKIRELKQLVEKYHNEGNQKEEAGYLNQVAYIYWENNNGKEAADYFLKSLELNRSLKNFNAVKNLCSNLGFIYSELGDYQKAIDYFYENLKINRSQKKRPDIASTLQNIAQVQFDIRSYREAIANLEEAVGIALEYNDMKLAQSCYLQLAGNYEKLGNTQKSKLNYEKSAAILSQLQKKQLETIEQQKNVAESQKNLAEIRAQQNAQQLQSTMDTLAEIKESYWEIQLKNELIAKENELKDLALKEEISSRNADRLRFFFAVTALVLLIFILLLIYNQYRRNKKANNLLKDQNREIEKQRDLANEQKKKITDSILYSQRIQNAILPPKRLLNDLLNEHFVLFIPKDIVSGDFYWLSQKENILVLVAADCTGHGVPGALMSMLGIAFLNEIVNKIAINRHINSLQSDEILNELRRNIIGSLHQTGDKEEPKDGMDISLCIIDFETKKLQFSGAHNPLYIVRNGDLVQYDGDKMPLSYHKNKDLPFTRHDISLKDNDTLYIFSDGFIDQFGGDKGLKFLVKNFKELLVRIHQKPMEEQKEILTDTFNNWKGDRDQLDDVLVIGFRFAKKKKTGKTEDRFMWQNKQILIAEDTDVNYFLLAEALRQTNASLIRVKTGKEAVEFCKNNDVDLILMDINMPEMNGYEATSVIKGFRKDIPVIVQTALNVSDEKEKSMEAGADDYIAKPIDMKSFLIKLEHYLD